MDLAPDLRQAATVLRNMPRSDVRHPYKVFLMSNGLYGVVNVSTGNVEMMVVDQDDAQAFANIYNSADEIEATR